ncbi:Hypothetical protein A7982_01124 [Minicystis rosea]|nr:Hypothetical protein A7982_01124 [Minicystis rosea]
MRLRAAIAVGITLAAIGCRKPAETLDATAGAATTDPLAPLHAFEEERRRAADFERLPASDRALGSDPIAIRALPGAAPPRFVGLLRGRDALVLLDADLREIARARTPAFPVGIDVADDGEIAVVGEQSPRIATFTAPHDTLRARGDIGVGTFGLRDVALRSTRAGRVIHAIDERTGTLFTVRGPRERASITTVPTCAGAFRLAEAGDALLVDCLIDHAVLVFDLDAHGLPAERPRARIQHDGPIWSVAAASTREGLLIAAGGVEDHPLDRTEGSFGYIDSFVFVYRLAPGATQPERLAEVNVSEVGVITPKALLLRAEAHAGATVTVVGYGSDRIATLAWRDGFAAAPRIDARPFVPGVASIALLGDAIVGADPLFDGWARMGSTGVVEVPDEAPVRRTPASRVGEALFFTNLMAPWNHTDGRLSRFTCETCHFEGYTDGRTHHTGRGDVRATTKPLLGLFNNRPHFTRALDPDMATMVHNEFRVAGAKSDHDPWFSAADTGLAWVPLLGASIAELDAPALRRALMTFLMDFTHRPNPAVLGRDHFDERERRGAEVFARRCERCHEARLVTDEPSSRVPEERWESLVMRREGPIVWAATGYHKTGVEPYVHDLGARATSLRRLDKKRPYFTNGSARTLREVTDRARFQGESFFHDHAPAAAEALGEAEREALGAFLDLL